MTRVISVGLLNYKVLRGEIFSDNSCIAFIIQLEYYCTQPRHETCSTRPEQYRRKIVSIRIGKDDKNIYNLVLQRIGVSAGNKNR